MDNLAKLSPQQLAALSPEQIKAIMSHAPQQTSDLDKVKDEFKKMDIWDHELYKCPHILTTESYEIIKKFLINNSNETFYFLLSIEPLSEIPEYHSMYGKGMNNPNVFVIGDCSFHSEDDIRALLPSGVSLHKVCIDDPYDLLDHEQLVHLASIGDSLTLTDEHGGQHHLQCNHEYIREDRDYVPELLEFPLRFSNVKLVRSYLIDMARNLLSD